MTKEKYKENIQKQYDYVLEQVNGWHELVNVLQSIGDYINICICMTERVYDDKDINYLDYVELNEIISNNLKEVCRIVR